MRHPVKHVEFLDHLRGVAIVAVLLVHTLGTCYGYDVLPWKGWFRDFSVPVSFLCFLPVSFGQAGVPIFFVVSGFCIHLSFQQPGQRWGGFFIRRFFRIYPPYLVALIFSMLLILAHAPLDFHSQEVWMQLLTHLFLVFNFHPLTFSGFNAAFWSLAVEAQLYLLYPALLFLVAKLGWRRALVILAGCELLIRGADGLTQSLDAAGTIGGRISWCFASSPLGYWFSWSLGACIADAFLKKLPLPFVKGSVVGWLALAIVCYFVKPLYPFRFLLFAVMTAVVVSRLLSGAGPKIKLPSFSLEILKWIGLWSYSIYLLHQPLLQIYSYAIVWAVPGEYRPAPVAFLLIVTSWLAVIPFGILWYKLFELPGIAWGKRLIQKTDSRKVQQGRVEPTMLLPRPVVNHRTNPRLKGSYGLMIGALLVIAGGNCFISAKFTPPEPAENNNLAWSLATSPEAAHRNGTRAVTLAEDACQRTHYQETMLVGTLAAAYAEAGRFEEAVLTAQKACVLATKSDDQKLLKKNQELLALYLKRQPYHETLTNTRQ